MKLHIKHASKIIIGIAIGVLASACTRSQAGIYPIGNGEGVVLCGESITMNIVSEGQLFDMFEESLTTIEENCK